VLAAAAQSQWQTWLLLLLRTGMRVGEALALKWRDVDLAAGLLRIRATRWNGQEGTPKGGQARSVPLARDAIAALKAHRHLRGEYVFCHKDGRPLSHRDVADAVPGACEAAQLGRRLTAHDLRHTCASHLVMRGVNLVEVKEFLGHADISTTMRYAHLSPGRLQQAARVLELPAPQVGATWGPERRERRADSNGYRDFEARSTGLEPLERVSASPR